MADAEQSGQERTFDPSVRRLEDARKNGDVPRSRDLAHLLVLGGAAAALYGFAGALFEGGRAVIARGLTFDAALASDPALLVSHVSKLTAIALTAVAPILGLLLLAAIAAPLAIGGWMFVPSNAAPKVDRIDPLQGFGRLLSVTPLVELSKVLLAATLLVAVGGAFIYTHLDQFATLANKALAAGLADFGTLAMLAFALLVSVLAVTSAIDVPFQIVRHRTRLKMTLHEVKQEQRETEGDPQIKARIRGLQRDLARKRMMAAVPKADVIITNPTHFAVALKYSTARQGAPVVVAKGADAVAEKIKELAREHHLPQLEAPPLARALYRHVELNAEIPAALYAAVAQVLAYVFQLQRFAQGRGPRPVEPREIEIPPGLDPLEPLAVA